MRIGIDDTDSPRTMCTTYLGAVLVRKLRESGIAVTRAYLVRLNPNVQFKTRGNAAIALDAEGDPDEAFSLACRCVEELADFKAENTHPGVVVATERPSPVFYQQAVKDFCTVGEAIRLLDETGSLYRGYKNKRGLIGATAAVSAEFSDTTFEWLSYRPPERWGSERKVDGDSLFVSQTMTMPNTWDTVDTTNHLVVCVPHTPDPVLLGIRGKNPFWVAKARGFVQSESTDLEVIYATNQGTDVHLKEGVLGGLEEGRSYALQGVVCSRPVTRRGGHVQFQLGAENENVRCMAYEPTKDFRDTARKLLPGDHLIVFGSYKAGSINLEKIRVVALAEDTTIRPPLCVMCGKRMTSAGKGKGYKCRRCREHSSTPERAIHTRKIGPGWYEVPSCARRHLARPLARGISDVSGHGGLL
ncbi:MAG: tRNA(Ile)(2)-agmatinylcytidine synthase [Methanomicrobiales archaeon]|nr:tRNA(Ile)(2)-agmatinylcytidine synthase [Methanomicrobiales archaeon]